MEKDKLLNGVAEILASEDGTPTFSDQFWIRIDEFALFILPVCMY